MSNLNDPLEPTPDGIRAARVAERAGAEHLGASVYELQPGEELAAGSGPSPGSRLTHERARSADDEPGAAELDHVLAQHLPCPAIADVVVERPSGVGDLELAVRAARRPQQGALRARTRLEAAAQDVRRPARGAGAGAVAVAARVAGERVEGKAS